MMIFSPMEQFNMVNFLPLNMWGIDFSISNLAMVCIALLVFGYFFSEIAKTSEYYALVPNYYQTTIELLLELLTGLVKDNIGDDKESRKYLAWVTTIFVTVLGFNLLGLLPYVFSVTSMVSIAMTLSLTIFFGITIKGLLTYNVEFFSMFLPSGAPLWLAPLLVVIELISYLARGFSLGIRLGANLISGHILLGVIAGFAYTILNLILPTFSSLSNILFFIPFLFCFGLVFILFFLEIMVSFIQAFVISLLLCIYLGDIKNLMNH